MQTTRVKAAFRSVTPLIPAGSSLASALAFYTEQMGFSVVWQGGGMAGIARDDVAFNLAENDNQAWAANASFSIGVSDLKALYEEYRTLPARVGALETKPWGGGSSTSSRRPGSPSSSTSGKPRNNGIHP
jgi:hypothetical protein